MENHELAYMAKKILHHDFCGVYSIDNVNKGIYEKENFSIILNLDKSTGPGTHFVSVYATKDTLEYVDSFGFPPFISHVLRMLKKLCKRRKFVYNEKTIQPDKSHFCGLYSLAYLLSKDFGFTLREYQRIFTENPIENNDILVEEFISELLKYS